MWILWLTVGFVLTFVVVVAFILSCIIDAMSNLFKKYPIEEEDEYYD
jgi:Na+-transporting methylmalonyl-CoA/oxaloacetate decarboxylase gamma subunit